MVERAEASTCSRPQRRSTKDGEYAPRWELKREWLPRKSDGLEHGHKAHRMSPSGHIEEIGDNERAQSRKKIKAISSRQWVGGEHGRSL